MKIDIFHPILWSKYKAAVFSEMYRRRGEYHADIRFFQVAETDGERAALSGVDLSHHKYPYRLLFKGSYGRIPTFLLARNLFTIVLKSDADLILLPGFSEISHWCMLFAAMLSGKKRMVFCDSTLLDREQSKIKGTLKRLFFLCSNGYLTYGERGRQYLEHYGAKKTHIFRRVQAAALPAGYSTKIALDARIVARAAASVPTFLYVGRLSPEKAIDVLLRAFHAVKSIRPEAILRIVGDGVERDELERISESLGLRASVAFIGGLDLADLALEYQQASCFILPSKSEPWGLVVNEALHFGCPVIVSSNCGCVPELVVEGVNGFQFAVGDAQHLATRMLQSLDVFSDVEPTARACLRVINDFTPTNSAEQTLAAASALLEARR